MTSVKFAKSLLFLAAAALAGGSLPTSAQAANTWLGAAIMPKSDQLRIQNDNQIVGGVYDIAWPAAVTKTNGRWLWIEDEGGYSNPPVGGWVYADDVVRLDAARGYYTTELLKNKTAVLYWLRGIYWESQNEPAIAMADYKAAEALDQPLTIDDVAIRYGRLLAATHMQNGAAPYKPASPPPDHWDAQFQAAERANGRRPQLYLDWGMAGIQKCRSRLSGSLAQSDAKNLSDRATKVAKFLDTLVAQAGTTASDLTGSAGKGNQGTFMKKAKSLTQQLAIAAALADEVAGDVDEVARKASEFGGVAAPEPKTVTKQLIATKVNDDTVQAAINGLVTAANRAADSSAKLQKAIGVASSAASAPAATRTGPSPAQRDAEDKAAATAALDRLGRARSLNPNWWRTSMALGELVLNHYERQTPQGDLQPLPAVSLGFRQALGDFRAGTVGANELPAPRAPTAEAAVLAEADLLDIAEEYFDEAIGQNPDSIDAYRDRAEVSRLKAAVANNANRPQEARHYLTSAQDSAAHACLLGNYRQPGSLRTLAQVDSDLKLYGPAADLAERALAFLPPEDQPLYQPFWNKYVQIAEQAGVDSGAVADANTGSGAVAMRGEVDRAAPNLGSELTALLSEFSDPSSGLNVKGTDYQLAPAKTRGEGSNSGPELQLIRRPPPRLPPSFIQRAP